MTKSGLSILVFGIYLALAGLGFILVPNLILPAFGFARTSEIWIRVTGLLVLILAMYFLYALVYTDVRFYRATIIARLMFATGNIAFTLLGLGAPALALFAAADLAGAAWTGLALRAEGKEVKTEK